MMIGITGGTGLLGQDIIKYYATESQFVVPTRQSDCSKFYQHKNVTYVVSTYSYESFEETFKDCDAIIHAGSNVPARGGECVGKYVPDMITAEVIFNICMKHGIKDVVYISSLMVYDPNYFKPTYQQPVAVLKEEDAYVPGNHYGMMKQYVERMGEYYSKTCGMQVRSLRFPRIVGVGEWRDTICNRWLNDIQTGKPICVQGKGETGYDYLYTKDLARAVIIALSTPDTAGVYNITSGRLCSNLELAQTLCDVFKSESGYYIDESLPENGRVWLMDSSKADRVFKFKPEYNVRSMFEDLKRELWGRAVC